MVHSVVTTERVRTLIVGGLEQGVVVGCFLPADGLKGLIEIDGNDPIEVHLRLAAVSIQSWSSASSFNFTWGEGVLMIKVSFLSTRRFSAVSNTGVRWDLGQNKSFAHRNQGPRRLSSVC